MIKFLETILKTLLLLCMLFIVFVIFVNCGGPAPESQSIDQGLFCRDEPPTSTCAPTCDNQWVRVINGTETRFPSQSECLK